MTSTPARYHVAAPANHPIPLYVAILASSNHPAPPTSNTILLEVVFEPDHQPRIGLEVSLHLLQATVVSAHHSVIPPYTPVPSFRFVGKITGERTRTNNTVVFVVANREREGYVRKAFVHIRTQPGLVAPVSAALTEDLVRKLRALQEMDPERAGSEREDGTGGPTAATAPWAVEWPSPQNDVTSNVAQPPVPLPWTQATPVGTATEDWSRQRMHQGGWQDRDVAWNQNRQSGWSVSSGHGEPSQLRTYPARVMDLRHLYSRPAALHPTKNMYSEMYGLPDYN
ncbi:hypothetical protein OH77DRAFT_1590106 [Trametes cingulata]|nr:hypothetical protein OH77DRAFT_1590106 [Trametes cingulata]